MAGTTVDFKTTINPHSVASEISDRWTEWNNARQTKIDEWKELRNYVYATDTRTTADTSIVLKRAIRERRPSKGLVFHTDRGIEFTGKDFRKILKKHNMKPSVNRLGHCTDNGHMESYFHSLKAELIRGRKFNSMGELRYALNSYINHFYNKKRLHSGIGYCSPIEYEQMAA